MSDILIVIGDIMFPRRHFHSAGMSMKQDRDAEGNPVGEPFPILHVNLVENRSFTIGGTEQELYMALSLLKHQLGMKTNLPEVPKKPQQPTGELNVEEAKEAIKNASSTKE